MNQLQKCILDTIKTLLDRRLESLSFDKTLTGMILNDNGDGTFDVEINGDEYKVKARGGLDISVYDIVYIKVPMGKMSEKFIDLVRP